jgi:hypothetical protein
VITTELSIKLSAEMLVYTETVISIAHNLLGFFLLLKLLKIGDKYTCFRRLLFPFVLENDHSSSVFVKTATC